MRPPLLYRPKSLVVFACAMWFLSAACLLLYTYVTYLGISNYRSDLPHNIIVHHEPKEPYREIVPGVRPASIDGAEYCLASDLSQKNLEPGMKFCVEGAVTGTHNFWGDQVLWIECRDGQDPIQIHHYRQEDRFFNWHHNYIIRVHVDQGGVLTFSGIVTQQQIDKSLQDETLLNRNEVMPE